MKGCTTMTHRPSEKCDDCFWWYEDRVLCLGCPNNPETKKSKVEKKSEATMSMKESGCDILVPLLIPV
jgi:hypothetical protein